MRGGIGAPGPLPWIPHCYVTKAVSIKKKTNVGSARRVKWLIKPSFNYMFTCSLFSHPMLKCVEYKLFLYFFFFYLFAVKVFDNHTILSLLISILCWVGNTVLLYLFIPRPFQLSLSPIPLLGQGYDSPWCNTRQLATNSQLGTATLIHEH